MKLYLLTNTMVVEDAIKFVKESNGKISMSKEGNDKESKEPDYNDNEDTELEE
jgi:hypothetical protein